MEGNDSFERRDARGTSLKKSAVIYSLLPVLLLGATYYLLVEFGLRVWLGVSVVPAPLRIGGAVLIALCAATALGCALYLADQFRRPLRALLRAAEGEGEKAAFEDAGRSLESDPDVRRLSIRIDTLVQQNRSGAQALRDLESAQDAAVSLGRIRDGMGQIARRLGDLAGELSREEVADEANATDRESTLAELERLATVWALQIERARRDIPHLPGELGSCFSDFSTALTRLRETLFENGRAGPVAGIDPRSEIVRLQETIAGWSSEKGAAQ